MDLQVALYWIQGVDREWKPFVRNRTAEIRQKVAPERWSHCPGDQPGRPPLQRHLSSRALCEQTVAPWA